MTLECESGRATDLMCTDLLVVSEEDRAYELGRSMEKFRVGRAIVADDLEFKGVVSKETFVSHLRRHPGKDIKSLSVRDFMESDVCTLKEDDSLETVVEVLMSQKSMIDCAPVISSGKVKGVVSLSEMTSYFAKNLAGKFKVSQLMHYNPPTFDDYAPVSAVVDSMRNMSVKRVLILSGENLSGIVTIKDIGICIFRGMDSSNPKSMSELSVSVIMVKNPITVTPRDDAAYVAKLMCEKKFGGFPVVGSSLEGMIERADLLKGIKLSLDY
jgi:predicted transcriptional regulator